VSESAILDLRPYLFSIAYRMLGTVSDAEDVVQEAYLRMTGVGDIQAPKAYAATVTTRIALDTLRSARVRREQYVGQWLPEPLLVDDAGPEQRVELDESVSSAFLVVLESLSALERAAFLLHDVLDYSYPEVARILERDEPACRQLVSRSRRHLADRRPRFDADLARRDQLAAAFLAAAADGDVHRLESLLADDITCIGDGGGKAPAAAQPVTGRTRAARFLVGLWRQASRHGVAIAPARVNGQPGVVARSGDAIVGVMSLIISDGRIVAVHNVINPDKLRHLGPVLSWGSLQDEG
jgi:RNA polymerase sigma-70 factor (TIGR02957 family)